MPEAGLGLLPPPKATLCAHLKFLDQPVQAAHRPSSVQVKRVAFWMSSELLCGLSVMFLSTEDEHPSSAVKRGALADQGVRAHARVLTSRSTGGL